MCNLYYCCYLIFLLCNLIILDIFQVCHLHFASHFLFWRTSYFDQKTGKKLQVALQKPQLRDDAVPSNFPGYPQYMTKKVSNRESPTEKRHRLESRAAEAARGKCESNFRRRIALPLAGKEQIRRRNFRARG